jgi:hypothetical protein
MPSQAPATARTPNEPGAINMTPSARRALSRRLRESPLSAGAISIAIHLVAFAILLKVVWQDRPTPPRQIIAEAWLGQPGGGTSGGPGSPRPKAPKPAPKPAQTPPVSVNNVVRAAAGPKDDDLKRLIGTFDASAPERLPAASGSAGETGRVGLGLGGTADGLSGGGSGSGSFGAVGEDGPVSGFFGQRGNAYKVVYVIDTSGSLVTIFGPVQQALIESIDQLRPTQSFHVIFAGARPVELPARRLVPALAAYKEPAKKFIRELAPEAQCDPVAAMERAFAAGPELIYFLTDGDFKPQIVGILLGRLREWNADKRVHITTIGFGVKLANSQLAGQPVGEAVLRQIAQEHGGNFRWVDPNETEERK